MKRPWKGAGWLAVGGGWRSASGACRVAVLLSSTIVTLGCTDWIFAPVPESDPVSLYEELWAVFDRGYAPFAERGVDWEIARELHRPSAEADDDALFAAASDLLAELDDGHVTLVAPGQPVFVAKRTFREDTHMLELDLAVVFSRMIEGPFRTGDARYGLLPGDIGYVHVASWSDPIADLDGLLGYLETRAGVVVDLRHNPGGDFTNGFPFAARFADLERLAFTTLTKTGPGRSDLGQRQEWSIGPSGAVRYGGPVVVLTNGFTNSAAERTLMAFRTMPHVTVVGTPTAGNHGEKVGGELSNGWRYSIVPQVVVAADGVSYEGPGLPPDVHVSNTAAEVADGVDRQLDVALTVLATAIERGR